MEVLFPSDAFSEAWGPLLPYSTQETTSEVASKHWRALRFFCLSCLKLFLVGTVFWVFRASFNHGFLWFLLSKTCLGVGGRSLCGDEEMGLPAVPVPTYMWIYWQVCETGCCGVNVTQKSSPYILTHDHNPEQLLFSTAFSPQTYQRAKGWMI